MPKKIINRVLYGVEIVNAVNTVIQTTSATASGFLLRPSLGLSSETWLGIGLATFIVVSAILAWRLERRISRLEESGHIIIKEIKTGEKIVL